MDATILNYNVNDGVSNFLSKNKQLYIDGKWVDSNQGKRLKLKILQLENKLLLAQQEIALTLI